MAQVMYSLRSKRVLTLSRMVVQEKVRRVVTLIVDEERHGKLVADLHLPKKRLVDLLVNQCDVLRSTAVISED